MFYANLKVVQDDDQGLVLQSSMDGHIITVDPHIISQIIGVPVLQQSARPYNNVVLHPSLDDL
jgi:DNA-binding transcriptional regulator of glucitol operon